MLFTSQLTVSYSFAESDQESELNAKSEEPIKKERFLKVILTEKIVNGKLETRYLSLPNDRSTNDVQKILSKDSGQTKWTYVNYKKFQVGIVLFDGKTAKIGGDILGIPINEVSIAGKEIELVDEKANTSNKKYENTSDEEFIYRVIFSGKMTNAEGDNIFVMPEFENNMDSNSEQSIKLPINEFLFEENSAYIQQLENEFGCVYS